jgi:TolB-like protein
MTSKIFNLPSAYVSETEEEEDSNESDERTSNWGNKRQLKVLSLAHLSQMINKQIFSDDFDHKSFKTELSRRYKNRVGGPTHQRGRGRDRK